MDCHSPGQHVKTTLTGRMPYQDGTTKHAYVPAMPAQKTTTAVSPHNLELAHNRQRERSAHGDVDDPRSSAFVLRVQTAAVMR